MADFSTTGPTGTPFFLDECKIDDIFVMEEAGITPP